MAADLSFCGGHGGGGPSYHRVHRGRSPGHCDNDDDDDEEEEEEDNDIRDDGFTDDSHPYYSSQIPAILIYLSILGNWASGIAIFHSGDDEDQFS